MAATATTPLRVSIRALAWLTVVTIVVIALAAAVSGRYGILANAGDDGSGFKIGDAAKTSFGTVAVTEVEQVEGVTHRALNGATHGVSGLVDSRHMTIQAAITLSNSSKTPFDYNERQFRLQVTRNGRSVLQTASGGNLPNGTVGPGSGLAGHLDFTILRADAQLALIFDQPGRNVPIVIALGRSAFDPRAPGDHTH